ncbi:1-acyl-sn-glycerol-3-phosphate acyltransferase [Microbulbifer sp. OS29]|uniref:1-acyl-sn-glycerol-3-phosphate acyltransferase n=1 Tax=Microbulbifer okhotskensis TaxID=2926617 RepID=A0A9X2EQ36_9GAMM|nr:1-acyl-sn-glycerol-3-phosphate acyltransferase [Microbulbifer okhotskensis]MCO1333618.1 1-acyl-sn-glycerol-3-phosphate acyltransferase [Microbulbifer okhotskensis]
MKNYCVGTRTIARWVMGIKCEFRGIENLPKEGALILAAAHQSYLDLLLRSDVTALAKRELFTLPIIGPILRKIRVIRVDRKDTNVHLDMQCVGELVQAQKSLLLV